MKKKLSLIVIITIIVSFSETKAQPRSVGVTLGSGLEFSYQYLIGERNFIEFDAGLTSLFRGIGASAQYNWLFDIPVKFEGEMNWYAGIGAGLGFGWGVNSGFNIGAVPRIGIEYIFESIPLQFSFDYRPQIGIGIWRDGVYFNDYGLSNFGISIRYVI